MQDDCFGIQAVERSRDRSWGCLSIVSDPAETRWDFGTGAHNVSCQWQELLAKCLQLSTEGTGDPRGSSTNFLLLLFLDRITWFISTKSIWSYSSSTVKHFSNAFSIIIPSLQEVEVETANTPSPESDNGRALKADSLRSTRSLTHWTAPL